VALTAAKQSHCYGSYSSCIIYKTIRTVCNDQQITHSCAGKLLGVAFVIWLCPLFAMLLMFISIIFIFRIFKLYFKYTPTYPSIGVFGLSRYRCITVSVSPYLHAVSVILSSQVITNCFQGFLSVLAGLTFLMYMCFSICSTRLLDLVLQKGLCCSGKVTG
jgi:hypothetical protein